MKFALTIDTDELEQRGIALGGLAGQEIGRAVVGALNSVVDSAYDIARQRMNAGINLSDDYIRRKMRVEHATPQKPEAALIANGTITSLSQYMRVQQQRDVNWSNARIVAAGHKFGKWPGWTKRKGNAPLGIPVDRKADGQSVSITSGERSGFAHAFSIAGKADSTGNLVMFSRKRGSGQMRALLGPAVYQLFKYQLDGALLGETEEALASALATQVQDAMTKVATP